MKIKYHFFFLLLSLLISISSHATSDNSFNYEEYNEYINQNIAEIKSSPISKDEKTIALIDLYYEISNEIGFTKNSQFILNNYFTEAESFFYRVIKDSFVAYEVVDFLLIFFPYKDEYIYWPFSFSVDDAYNLINKFKFSKSCKQIESKNLCLNFSKSHRSYGLLETGYFYHLVNEKKFDRALIHHDKARYYTIKYFADPTSEETYNDYWDLKYSLNTQNMPNYDPKDVFHRNQASEDLTDLLLMELFYYQQKNDINGISDLKDLLDLSFDKAVKTQRYFLNNDFETEYVYTLLDITEADIVLGYEDDALQKFKDILEIVSREKFPHIYIDVLDKLSLFLEHAETSIKFNDEYFDSGDINTEIISILDENNMPYTSSWMFSVKLQDIESEFDDDLYQKFQNFCQENEIHLWDELACIEEAEASKEFVINARSENLQDEIDWDSDEFRSKYIKVWDESFEFYNFLIFLDAFHAFSSNLKNAAKNTVYTSETDVMDFFRNQSISSSHDENLKIYFSKKYINFFQNIRTKLKRIDETDYLQFTKNENDYVINLSNTLFKKGDFKNANILLQIIKENEYINYVTRSNQDNVFSNLDIYEDDLDEYKKLIFEYKKFFDLTTKHEETGKDEIRLAANKSLDNLKYLLQEFKTSTDRIYSKNNDDFNLKNSGDFLKENEALVENYIIDDTLYTHLILHDEYRLFSKLIPEDEFKKNLLNFHSLISNHSNDIEKINQLSSYFSTFFIDDVIKFIKDDQQIVHIKFRNQGILNLLPISTLKIKNNYLIDSYFLSNFGVKTDLKLENISISITFYGASQGSEHFTKLPGVKKEINAISKIISSDDYSKMVYLDKDFNFKNLVKSFKNSTNTIHIASHFRNFGNLGDSSSLLLGDGSQVNFFDLNNSLPEKLENKLVTLSACDTGLNLSSNNSNNEALSNVFLSRGVKNTLGTLWKISDEATYLLMSIFYSLVFLDNFEPHKALSIAQSVLANRSLSSITKTNSFEFINQNLEVEKLTNLSHPYFWSSFIIYKN